MCLVSSVVGYSLPVGDPVSLAAVGVLLLALALLVYVYWSDRESEPTDPAADEQASISSPRSGGLEPASRLTDEELIRRWLAEADGELRQKELTQRSDWSKSKVSRLLSQMDDEGTIEKVSAGRENIIVLVDENGDRDGP